MANHQQSPSPAQPPRMTGEQAFSADVDVSWLSTEQQADTDVVEFVRTSRRATAEEKESSPYDWTEAENAAYDSGDWRRFSELRGYTAAEIENFGRSHELAGVLDARYGEDFAMTLHHDTSFRGIAGAMPSVPTATTLADEFALYQRANFALAGAVALISDAGVAEPVYDDSNGSYTYSKSTEQLREQARATLEADAALIAAEDLVAATAFRGNRFMQLAATTDPHLQHTLDLRRSAWGLPRDAGRPGDAGQVALQLLTDTRSALEAGAAAHPRELLKDAKDSALDLAGAAAFRPGRDDHSPPVGVGILHEAARTDDALYASIVQHFTSMDRKASLPERGEPLIVQTAGTGDEMELIGASIPEEQLAHLLGQPGVIHARNQHGAIVELSLDMDYDTPVVRQVVPGGADGFVAALAAHTPFPVDNGSTRPLAAPAASAAAPASVVDVWRAAQAGTPSARVEAANAHPELFRAFALEAAAASFAEHGLQPDSRQPFLAGIRRNIEADLAAGRPLADVLLRARVDAPPVHAIAER